MASRYWLKLFHETIYDPKIMMRSAGARLRWYECLCLAGDNDKDGELPPIEHMVFVFRISQEQLLNELDELVSSGLFTLKDGIYSITNWHDRQSAMDTNERSMRYRETMQKREYYEPVTKQKRQCNDFATIRDADIDKDIDKNRTEENISAPVNFTDSRPIIETNYTSVWTKSTGQIGIPQGDVQRVINAIDLLRPRFKNEDELIAYLKPYYTHWLTKKTKDGRPFSKSNTAWLHDWAISGEPLPGEKKSRERPDPNCKKCNGVGMLVYKTNDIRDPNFNKMVKCDCVKVIEEVEA